MNDDFLRRLRKAPPPEFLDSLKARLERQSPLAGVRWRRLPFSRGLLLGLLLGSAAFAITSLSVNRSPASFGDFLKAPAQLLARLGADSTRSDDGQSHRGTPLGPVWLPKHVAPTEEPSSASGSAALIAPPGTNTASPAATGRASESDRAPTPTPSAATQAIGTPYFGFTVVAPPTTYPHAQAVAQHLGNRVVGMKVALETGGAAVNRLCSRDYRSSVADLAELTDRITPAELRNCAFTLTELKVGHQAIMTARSSLYGPMSLSARALFLALARQVPVPTDPVLLMDNAYITWNQIDNTLPDDPIHFLGPGIGSVQGKLTAALLLSGCNTYPWIAALRTSDPARYAEICLSVRADGAYEARGESSVTDAERLEREPTLLEVFTLSEFNSVKDRLAASVIDGVLPTPETVAADTYPNSRTLYLYTKQYLYASNPQVGMLINAYLTPRTSYANAAQGDWGFVPLDETEHADVEAILHRVHLRP
jgi:phosphate transport system substrate-binding protein